MTDNLKNPNKEDLVLTISGLRKEIADLESRVIRWIPVTERLPEERKAVLGWWHDYEGDYIKDIVTHWSELPAGPEEGK